MGSIWAVCRDVGGTNALIPVMDLLKTKYKIRWIAQENGRGKEVLESLGYNFDIFSYDRLFQDKNTPNLVVSSMCSDAGHSLARFLKGICPIVAIQDQWTAGLNDVWINEEYQPDFVLVNDEFDKSLVLKAWFGINPHSIVVTGYPALDKYARFEIQAIKTRVRTKLLLIDDKPVVLFAGQWQQTGHALGELVRALNEIGREVYLVARIHPAMKDNAPEELPLWERALAEFHSGVVVDSSYLDISDVLAASDAVLSMYSTILTEAAVLKLPNIAILYPGYGQKVYRETAKLEEYPMVSSGCTAMARDYAELRDLVYRALSSGLGLCAAQEKTFRLDGKNAERAADFISRLIA